jgi:predicted nuclease of predicted toxin-antitoxin system
VTLEDFALLADENVDADVVAHFRHLAFDVAGVSERGWQGRFDADLIAAAVAEQRVIVTHDADFGRLALASASGLIGIVFLRPGHIDPQFTIDTINVVLAGQFQVSPPFILGAKRTGKSVAARVRHLSQP